MRAIEIAHAAVELQAALHDRNGCTVLVVGLLEVLGSDAFTRAIDELGPRIGCRQLESVREPAIQPCLQGMIRGVSLAGASSGWSNCLPLVNIKSLVDCVSSIRQAWRPSHRGKLLQPLGRTAASIRRVGGYGYGVGGGRRRT